MFSVIKALSARSRVSIGTRPRQALIPVGVVVKRCLSRIVNSMPVVVGLALTSLLQRVSLTKSEIPATE